MEDDFCPGTCFEQSPLKEQETYVKTGDYYFDSYSHFAIHQEMIRDSARTDAYNKAIAGRPQLFKDKIVLDVGSGTGILSVFAARAGASHVYAIQRASIAWHSRQIIRRNGLQSKITVLQGKVEQLQLPVDKVDIIISEWMGYFLLYESMLDSVLFARDKWLRPGGLMMPDRAKLVVGLIEDESYYHQKIDFWDDVYGIDMSCIKRWALYQPLVDCVRDSQIVSQQETILDLDLATVKASDLDFQSSVSLVLTSAEVVRGVTVWFQCYFNGRQGAKTVRLSTSPFKRTTHWKQTTFYVPKALKCEKDEKVEMRLAVGKCKHNPRNLDIKLGLKGGGATTVQYYRLS